MSSMTGLRFNIFFRQPAAEEAALKQGNDDEEYVRKQDKDERRDQDARVLLPEGCAFTDGEAHTGKIEKHAEVKVQQNRGVFPEADPCALREKASRVDNA